MKQTPLPISCILVTASLLLTVAHSTADTTNDFTLETLVSKYLPACHVQSNDTKLKILRSDAGETLDLTAARQENPEPRSDVAGYWYSSAMNFLGKQKINVARPDQAMGVIQLLHTISFSSNFVTQKLYSVRRFQGGWVVEADHDFTNYPGNIQQIHPYELLVDSEGKLTQLRQRCYHYLGAATVYSNTVISVYQREIKINGGRNYPEALEQELRTAWANEKTQSSK